MTEETIAAWVRWRTFLRKPLAQALSAVSAGQPMQPMQPIITDGAGSLRFKSNALVDALYEHGVKTGLGLNELACMDFTTEDRQQFAQLIGYSLSGYGTLSYVTDEAYAKAEHAAPAASPTPPAEQQAQPGAVYAELPEPALAASQGICCGNFTTGAHYFGQTETLCCGNPDEAWPESYTADQLRDFADRTHTLRVAAATQPAEAPGVPDGRVIDLIGKLVQAESNKTRTHQEYMGKAMPDGVYERFQILRDETIPALRTQLLDALAAPKAAPAGWKLVPDASNMTDEQAEAIAGVANCCGGTAYDIYRVALEAAPQAAPAVDAVQMERERICAAIKTEDDHCVNQGDYMLDSNDCIKIVRGEWVRPDFSIDAALAAQGGAR